MIEQQTDNTQKHTIQIKQILHNFKDLYKDTLQPQQTQQLFYKSTDQLFPKNKTSLTEHQVECLYDHFKVFAKKHYIGILHYDSLVCVNRNFITKSNVLMGDMVDPLENLKRGTINQILPFGFREFGIIQVQRDRNRHGVEWYGYRVYWEIPAQLKKAVKNSSPQLRIFLKIINFQWIKATELFHHFLKENQSFRTKYLMLTLIFDNLSLVQKRVYTQKSLKRIIQQRIGLQPLDPQRKQFKECRDNLVEVLNTFELISIMCRNYESFEDPYMQGCLYFLSLGKKSWNCGYQLIMEHKRLPAIWKYWFGRRFLDNDKYKDYKDTLQQTLQHTLEPQYIPFITRESHLKKIIKNQLQTNQNLQKASLLSIVLLNKKIYTFSSQKSFLNDIATMYFEYIKLSDCEDIQVKLAQFYQTLNDFRNVNQGEEVFTQPVVFIGCVNCGSSLIFKSQIKGKEAKGPKIDAKMEQYYNINNQILDQNSNFRVLIQNCLECSYKNSSCCVCLNPINMYSSTAYYSEIMKNRVEKQSFKELCQSFQDSFTYCPKCEHGGHYRHMVEWYERNPNICPVYDCGCRCRFP